MGLKIETMAVGPLQANCHLVMNEVTKEVVVVDPGDEARRILDVVKRRGGRVVAIWLTHAHIDHIGGAAAVHRETAAPVTIHPLEKAWLGDAMLCGATWIGLPFEPVAHHALWSDGQSFTALGAEWKVLHTPGHSPGSVCLICEAEEIAIVGDLVFRGSIGRMDLPGGSEDAMRKSLQRFFAQEKDLRIYCGHGPSTTMAVERRSNEFVRMMVGGDRA
jgi:glyoxylase-like metal-dependent hydrolase (beta-lactamase superfamily II)